ncbi:MAG TPA: alpha-amylase family glycosyl hydrolase [Anaerolineaceae bacterium]|nr:alpha-amylase family glycosyl hydrolase [Anaerolineaceae bacterium]HPN51465.1 alpha-amylase family glycosyl hydrolase [Anaerolineaceae bacterium]
MKWSFVRLMTAGILLLSLGLAAVQPAQATSPLEVYTHFPSANPYAMLPGDSLTATVRVYKLGITDPAGQGAGISCTLYYSPVALFGGSWLSTATAAMSYAGDSGTSDLYSVTLPSQTVGLKELYYACTDGSYTGTTSSTKNKIVIDAASGGCVGANQTSNNLYWNGQFHDSFSTTYRDPAGPVATSTASITLHFRTCMENLTEAPKIRIWNLRAGSAATETLTFDRHELDASLGGVTFWKFDLPVPATSNIYYYYFSAVSGTSASFYRDDDPKFYGGGTGAVTTSEGEAQSNSYQITIYDADYTVPEWMQRATIYQIFPDRFRDGDPSNNTPAGTFSYNKDGGSISRSMFNGSNPNGDWNYTICDPRGLQGAGYNCAGYYGDNFYGGDLKGITEKIKAGYFDALGITVLYLNPIFEAPSNHKYDTSNYMRIDPAFGTLEDFQDLAREAEKHGMRLILDGVFNHTSSDSFYFDRYQRYDAAGNLTSTNTIGTDDNSGACEGGSSPFYSWFYFPDMGNPGKDGATNVVCLNGADDAGQTYEAWWGYSSLPKLQANSAAVRQLIWNNGLNSVGPYWVSQGASGWRFDVGDDVDAGLYAPANNYWEGFRAAVRNSSVTGKDDVIMLGEVWGDASAWLLGDEWDSVMNYRMRGTLLNWLFTGCSGNGCTGGVKFEDNDSNSGSSSGAIEYNNPSQFNARLLSMWEDYPPMAWKAMMNLEGSHDTNRVLFLLTQINNGSEAAALQRLKELYLFTFTYAGAPTVYYGNEVALNHSGVWSGTKYEDDPYNRAPFPWLDAGGSSYVPDTTSMQPFVRQMASIRNSYRALQDGDVQHGMVIDDANKIYGYGRTYGDQTALVLLNRDGSAHAVTLSNLTAAPYNLATGTVMLDALNGATATVSAAGTLTVSVNPTWGAVLLENDLIDTPAASTLTVEHQASSTVTLSWPQVSRDTLGERETVTIYTLHRGAASGFMPSAGNQIATLTAPAFGSDGGLLTFTDPTPANASVGYKVCALNAAGKQSCSTLKASNTLPVAQPDVYTLSTGNTLTVPATLGVRINDSDADGDPLAIAVLTQPAHGTLTLSPDGSFIYTCTSLNAVQDTFTYSLTDGFDTVSATVTLNIASRSRLYLPLVISQ